MDISPVPLRPDPAQSVAARKNQLRSRALNQPQDVPPEPAARPAPTALPGTAEQPLGARRAAANMRPRDEEPTPPSTVGELRARQGARRIEELAHDYPSALVRQTPQFPPQLPDPFSGAINIIA